MKEKTGITKANRILNRWNRYARRCEKVAGPKYVPATRGYLKAYDRVARAWNRRNWRLETGE